MNFQMGKSGGKGISGSSNTVLQQMMMGQQQPQDYADSGNFGRQFTAIDEMVNQRLQQIAENFEEKKVAHSNAK